MIEKLELLDYHAGPPRRALIEVRCSTGTYVRSLAHDIGRAAGCGAYLGFLLRTAAGRFALADAVTIEEFDAAHVRGEADGLVYSIDFPLEHVAAVDLSARAAEAFAHGSRVCAGDTEAWPVRVYGPNRSFIGIGEVVGKGVLCPKMVLAPEQGEGECG
jgi:tRNA pseudouridine55 synthase